MKQEYAPDLRPEYMEYISRYSTSGRISDLRKNSATSKNGHNNEYSRFAILRYFSSGIIYSHKFRPFTNFFQKNRKYFMPGNFCGFSRKRRLDTFRDCSPVVYSYVANSQPALALVPAPCTLDTAHCTLRCVILNQSQKRAFFPVFHNYWFG